MSVMAQPGAIGELRSFCQSQGITEVYVSIYGHGGEEADKQFVTLIEALHPSHIRVEALFDGVDADLPGKSRDALLERVREIVRFNEKHPADRFDGVHLDIEPHQRPENKGVGNLKFLPGLVDAFRGVREIAEPAGLIVNADIPNKLLKGSLEERRMLLTSVPRVTLMLYELSSPDDGQSAPEKTEKLRKFAERYLAMTYDGLSDANLAKMAIALRTPDYRDQLPGMLASLDAAFRHNPHYLGWARHS
jgi:hypothetical protein